MTQNNMLELEKSLTWTLVYSTCGLIACNKNVFTNIGTGSLMAAFCKLVKSSTFAFAHLDKNIKLLNFKRRRTRSTRPLNSKGPRLWRIYTTLWLDTANLSVFLIFLSFSYLFKKIDKKKIKCTFIQLNGKRI